MKYFGAAVSEKHSALGRIIRKKDCLDEAKRLFTEVHAAVNMPQVYGTAENELSLLLSQLPPGGHAVMPTAKDVTIAWALWHLARIEDVTMNMLVARGEQLFDDEWQRRICSPVVDTGNAMTDDEMMELSRSIDMGELICYRNSVAQRTRDIVTALSHEDMRRRAAAEDIARIAECGAVTAQEESAWLLEYWGGKDVAGLLLMPPTRHALMHLNECARIKQQLTTRKSFYRN